MKKNLILLLIIAVFVVGGAIFAYALTQNEVKTKEDIEVYKEETTCSGDCNGDCNGECGATYCGCQKKVTKSCGCSKATSEACGVTPGSCGSSSCSGECAR